ncbi:MULTISPECIES: hypothetical protein [Pontibacillus]|uniref:Uncharacterized protein n=1 Tax=Pontibacillus chungwhensis TaxID=265426 RepID=A0ABY8UYX8_9BACI|nr:MULTISPECIES: hypothetical protein [Pontibacillus]MCD5324921.1 hypothetical protein [Pontibacillus sp. HN14]WIF98880.1 hypothetical protein QNI29_04280 [Pontibacillus chungwhensis]
MIKETVIIEGSVRGMKFSKPILLQFNPSEENIEEAIIKFFNSHAQSFEELAVQRGWRDSYWTFPQYYELVI